MWINAKLQEFQYRGDTLTVTKKKIQEIYYPGKGPSSNIWWSARKYAQEQGKEHCITISNITRKSTGG